MGSAADVALLPSLHQSAAAGILEIKILYISYGPPTIDGALGMAQGVFIAPNPDPTRKAARPDQGLGLVSRPESLAFCLFFAYTVLVYMEGQNMLRISNMTGKLDGLKALNTNTLTNDYCIKMNQVADDSIICKHCYSMEMLQGLRKNCAPSWQANSDILSGGLIPQHMLPTILDAFFRFSGHGELLNLTMLENFHNITLHNPHCTFALWTKRKGWIRKFYSQHEKPANLILIYSNPRIDAVMDQPPAFFDRTFNNVNKRSDVEQNCTGQKCKDCLLCYTRGNGVTTIIEAVK